MEQSLQSRAQGDDAVWNGLGLRGTSYRAPAPAPRPGRGERLEIPGAGRRRASGCRGPRRGRLSEELLTHDGLFPVRGRGRGSVRRAHGGHPVFWTAGAVPDDYLVGAAPTPARSRFGTGRAASACELPNRVRAADSQPARHRLAGGPCDSEGLPLRPPPPDRCSAALPGGREGSPGEAVGTLGPLGHPPRPARPLLRRLVRRRPRVRGPGQPSRAAASGARALVVHEAFETIVCAAGSYAAVLTPNASVTSAPSAGALMSTLLAPASRWARAAVAEVKRPVAPARYRRRGRPTAAAPVRARRAR